MLPAKPKPEKRALRLYVWENVLRDYWPGMAVAVARSRDEAVRAIGTRAEAHGEDAGPVIAELSVADPQVIPLHPYAKTQGWYVKGSS